MGRSVLAVAAAAAIERAAVTVCAASPEDFADLQRGLYRTLLSDLVEAPLPGGVLDGTWPEGVEPGFAVTGVAELGGIHEELKALTPVLDDGVLRLQPGTQRRLSGVFYTPPALVEHLLDTALEPTLDEVGGAVRVCDPTCGSGVFLVAAMRRIQVRLGPARAVEAVHGIDLDPVAVELARVALWVQAGMPADFGAYAAAVTIGNALVDPWMPEFDVVVGNPPFLNQLSTATALDRVVRAGLGSTGAYTDVSALILLRSLDLLRPGGRVALVQPQSLLASRDAAPVRRHLLERAALAHLWASDEPAFNGTSVLTCAPTLAVGCAHGPVSVTYGPSFAPMRPVAGPAPGSGWSYLLTEGLGVPQLDLQASGELGDLASCTADFRDQYYGLIPYVADGEPDVRHARLVTSGLVEPAECRWGAAPVRFAKQRFERPVVDLAALDESPLADWARQRLVSKVLVATQSRVIEAVVDESGEWLPSVPVVTVAAEPARLWHVLAVLCAPPVSAYALTHWAGTGLTMQAIKLSARQVGSLPLPVDTHLWDEGARLARDAQQAPSAEARSETLRDLARVMTDAYGSSAEVLAWWLQRARLG